MKESNRRALCIGINDYPGTHNDLKGCVNDAQDWASELRGQGFDVAMLLNEKATHAAMVESIRGVIRGAGAEDRIVITFSGHGTWMQDENGDEADMRDEAICPYDLTRSGPLLDDTLYELFSERERGVHLAFISDSCHSGTVARYAVTGAETRRVRFMPLELFAPKERLRELRALERAPQVGRSRGGALLLAGCQDSEVSYDASFDGRPNGAFTRHALDALGELRKGENRSPTYRDWFRAIRARLPSIDFQQRPNVVATATQREWPVF